MTNLLMLIAFIAWLSFIFALMYFFSNWFILLLPFFTISIERKAVLNNKDGGV